MPATVKPGFCQTSFARLISQTAFRISRTGGWLSKTEHSLKRTFGDDGVEHLSAEMRLKLRAPLRGQVVTSVEHRQDDPFLDMRIDARLTNETVCKSWLKPSRRNIRLKGTRKLSRP